MKIVHVASEAQPFSKTGGLADVAASLPAAQAAQGHEVRLVTPWYGPLSSLPDEAVALGIVHVGHPWPDTPVRVFGLEHEGVRRVVLHRPEYFDREHLYGPPGEAYFDNPERFVFFSRAAQAAIATLSTPDIIHCHDWHTALLPALVRYSVPTEGESAPASVVSIHNLAFQGICENAMFSRTGLPAQAWSMHEGEYFGRFNILKAGLAVCDGITTVSPTYAREILTPGFGCGLDAFLSVHEERISGIVNGIDVRAWSPATDAALDATYTADTIGNKESNTQALLQDMGLSVANSRRPIIGFVGRLTPQKGADVLAEALPDLLRLGVDFVLLGRGDADLEEAFTAIAKEYPERAAVVLDYDESLSHRIIAGSDMFIMPSRFEPCGLTQLYAMAYGTLPITTKVGGLVDTVKAHPDPDAVGFQMASLTRKSVVKAVRSALDVFSDKKQWRAMQERGMSQDLSWTVPARRYCDLYENLLSK